MNLAQLSRAHHFCAESGLTVSVHGSSSESSQAPRRGRRCLLAHESAILQVVNGIHRFVCSLPSPHCFSAAHPLRQEALGSSKLVVVVAALLAALPRASGQEAPSVYKGWYPGWIPNCNTSGERAKRPCAATAPHLLWSPLPDDTRPCQATIRHPPPPSAASSPTSPRTA